MKRHTRRDIWMLLSSLVVFSVLIGCLVTDSDARQYDQDMKQLSVNQLLARVAPLVDSGSMQMVARSLFPLNEMNKKKILLNLISPKNNRLALIQKKELIFDLASYIQKKEDLADLFELLIPLNTESPVLYSAAKLNYARIIPKIRVWLAKDPDRLHRWSLQAFQKAIDEKRLDIYQTLLDNGLTLSPDEAQEFVWRTIEMRSKALFIPELIKLGATVHVVRNGRSPLIYAVEQNDEELVSMLIETGASINAMADPVVGTALQRALNLGYQSIELLLREKGARE